ncbi:DNA primase small subunit PriS [Candidatus Bathyarchaeota archaeon]|nr:DNA primase small subunit PriS [Candidatus Bathyarchaeota archaeon]
MSEDWGSIRFVKNQFRRFYEAKSKFVKAPTEILRREFGFLSFEGKTMIRHLSFNNEDQLRSAIVENTPAHIYYSSAYYKNPEAEMDKKCWLGADLVFDIDADHIDTACKEAHDNWICKSCGLEGRGRAPQTCSRCGKNSFEEEAWLCDRCLEAAKFEAQKLIDILIQDLGFTPLDLEVNFTGNRGYHVHVKAPMIHKLDQIGRREIVDYITGTGLKVEFHGFSRTRGGASTMADPGWRGRTARAVYDYLSEADEASIQGLKLSSQALKNILEEKSEILKVLREDHSSRILKYLDLKSLQALVEASIKKQASAIDTVVTTDLHRLIRLPNTLHGKTGFMAQRVNLDDLEDYDPLTRAIAFKGDRIRVMVKRAPKFRIGNEVLGPFKDEQTILPVAGAVFLLCRRAARVEG